MSVFMVFTRVLSWVRQYLVLHTGQRIDAVLGSQVFERLLRLPLLLFPAPTDGRDRRPNAGNRAHPPIHRFGGGDFDP
jgi:hypothetical protein